MKYDNETIALIWLVLTVAAFCLFMIYMLFPSGCPCGAMEGSCPCPNQDIKEDMNAWGAEQRARGNNVMYPASSAGSWLSLCEDWQEATNRTEECFQ